MNSGEFLDNACSILLGNMLDSTKLKRLTKYACNTTCDRFVSSCCCPSSKIQFIDDFALTEVDIFSAIRGYGLKEIAYRASVYSRSCYGIENRADAGHSIGSG